MPNRIIALVFVACLALPVAAWAQRSEVIISTGHPGGSYYEIGERFRTTMIIRKIAQVRVESSSGSIQNLARLADPKSDVGIALTQADALARFLKDNPDFSNEFIVLGDAGKECVVLISSANGSIERFADLKEAPPIEISVDDRGSGASVTFDYMTALDPGLANVKPVYVDTIEALLQMKVAGQLTSLKAAMVVQRPSMVSGPVKVLLDNPQDYRLVPILESDVENRTLPDGSVVYSFEKVAIGKAVDGRSLAAETICTRGMMLASKAKVSREVRSKMSMSMLEHSDTVFGKKD